MQLNFNAHREKQKSEKYVNNNFINLYYKYTTNIVKKSKIFIIRMAHHHKNEIMNCFFYENSLKNLIIAFFLSHIYFFIYECDVGKKYKFHLLFCFILFFSNEI